MEITAIQETRWPEKSIATYKDYKFYYSGKSGGPKAYGTGFLLTGRAMHAVIGFTPVDERLCTLRIKGKFFNITFINVHAPTEDKDDETKNICYENLQRVFEKAPRRDL